MPLSKFLRIAPFAAALAAVAFFWLPTVLTPVGVTTAQPMAPHAELAAQAPAPAVPPLPAVPRLPAMPAIISAPPPRVSAPAYTIMDASCGAFIYGQDEHTERAPASLTKIITALVVRKYAPEDAMVTVDIDYHWPQFEDSTLMGLEPNMRLSVHDLLYGLFLPSGNDAALQLAEYVGQGDVDKFVGLMNDEARELGLKDTHFTNPSGLDEPGLYSSAYDMDIAGLAALQDPLLRRISDTQVYQPAWQGDPIKNGNAMLKSYPGSIGLKTGYTEAAKQTIVAVAQRGPRRLIVSVFGADDRYMDAGSLLDWAFTLPPVCPGP